MVKEFWKYICEELNYRFFAGVPCLGLDPLYKSMDNSMMYYTPAVNERIALGIISGVWLSGNRGGVLLDAKSFVGLENEIKVIKDFNIPILLIVYSDSKMSYPFWHKELSSDFKKDLDTVYKRSKSNKPSIIVINEGVLL